MFATDGRNLQKPTGAARHEACDALLGHVMVVLLCAIRARGPLIVGRRHA